MLLFCVLLLSTTVAVCLCGQSGLLCCAMQIYHLYRDLGTPEVLLPQLAKCPSHLQF